MEEQPIVEVNEGNGSISEGKKKHKGIDKLPM
jgi:hypothetical protein